VRPQEDIEAKVSGLYAKISRPVLSNLRLATTGDVRLLEVYPPQLPDLFHGQQLTVLGRYSGNGPSAIKLTGRVGKEAREFVYELTFPKSTGEKESKDFVEHLWARRKVGYLLDQIRATGENKELVSEVVRLAKRYGITTPYTSYLIVPDTAVPPPIVRGGGFGGLPPGALPGGGAVPEALRPPGPSSSPKPVVDFARKAGEGEGKLGGTRNWYADETFKRLKENSKDGADKPLAEAKEKKEAYDRARELLRNHDRDAVQAGKLGVDLSLQTANLRSQARLERTALRQVRGRTLLEIGGVWIDEGFTAKTTTVVIKAQSNAYFKLLASKPALKELFRLGNYLVWVTPSGTALVIDVNDGKSELSNKEIDALFTAKK
jgi:Ca-activated chloride channel family protein